MSYILYGYSSLTYWNILNNVNNKKNIFYYWSVLISLIYLSYYPSPINLPLTTATNLHISYRTSTSHCPLPPNTHTSHYPFTIHWPLPPTFTFPIAPQLPIIHCSIPSHFIRFTVWVINSFTFLLFFLINLFIMKNTNLVCLQDS